MLFLNFVTCIRIIILTRKYKLLFEDNGKEKEYSTGTVTSKQVLNCLCHLNAVINMHVRTNLIFSISKNILIFLSIIFIHFVLYNTSYVRHVHHPYPPPYHLHNSYPYVLILNPTFSSEFVFVF